MRQKIDPDKIIKTEPIPIKQGIGVDLMPILFVILLIFLIEILT